MLAPRFPFSRWLLLLGAALTLAQLLTLALGQEVNPFSNNIYAVFADPVLFLTLVTAVSGWLTERITDAVKDRSRIKGWHTRAIAAATAAVLAGGAGYFGLSYFTDVDGLQGAGAAAASAFMAWAFADVNHRARMLRETGMRGPDRREEHQEKEQLAEAVAGAGDSVLAGLLASAATLHPAVAIGAPVLINLYKQHGAQVVKDLIAQQRALLPAEAKEYVEGSQKDRAIVARKPAEPTEPPPSTRPSNRAEKGAVLDEDEGAI